jgi:hypothetical protein
MKGIRTVLLTTLLLLPAARPGAQPYDAVGPRELYHAEVCNAGQITVDVAVAYKDFGVIDEFWVIDYWYRVLPQSASSCFNTSMRRTVCSASRASRCIWPLRSPTRPVCREPPG